MVISDYSWEVAGVGPYKELSYVKKTLIPISDSDLEENPFSNLPENVITGMIAKRNGQKKGYHKKYVAPNPGANYSEPSNIIKKEITNKKGARIAIIIPKCLEGYL